MSAVVDRVIAEDAATGRGTATEVGQIGVNNGTLAYDDQGRKIVLRRDFVGLLNPAYVSPAIPLWYDDDPAAYIACRNEPEFLRTIPITPSVERWRYDPRSMHGRVLRDTWLIAEVRAAVLEMGGSPRAI